LHNRPPHLPLRWLLRCPWLTLYAKHGTHIRTHRDAMAPKQDYCGCTMPGDICSRGVNHMRQVNTWKELLNQLLAKFALHERVGGNHADVAGRLRVLTIDRKIDETFCEWDSERVFLMAGRVALAVCLVQPLILNRNVGRVPHYDMVLLPQN